MAWSKWNNPNKRRKHRRIDRTEADIIAIKNMLEDRKNGVEMPLSFYDEQSDRLCNKPSRNIYN